MTQDLRIYSKIQQGSAPTGGDRQRGEGKSNDRKSARLVLKNEDTSTATGTGGQHVYCNF